MTVCKFFVQGNCRYGERCWNEHPRGGPQKQLSFGGGGGGGPGTSTTGWGNQNRFKWLSSEYQQQNTSGRQAETAQTTQPAEILRNLSVEVNTWEQSKMWPFSSVGFEREAASLPGFEDTSPEELRLEAYEAQKAGNLQPYLQKIQQLTTEYNNKRNEVKTMPMALKQKLFEFIEDARRKNTTSSSLMQSSTLAGASTFSSSSGNPFGSATTTQPGGGNLFGASPSVQPSGGVFGSSPTSIFGTPAGNATGIFGAKSTSPLLSGTLGSPSPFGSTQAQQSVFGATGSQSIFGTTPQNLNTTQPFSVGSTPFSSGTPTSQGTSVFGAVPSSGNVSTPAQVTSQPEAQKSGLYTPISELTSEELEAFKAPSFTFGKIPTKPPPRELIA